MNCSLTHVCVHLSSGSAHLGGAVPTGEGAGPAFFRGRRAEVQPPHSRGLLALAWSHLLHGWGDERQRAGPGRGPHAPLRCIPLPGRQAGAAAVPHPAQVGCAGDSRDQHLVTVLTAPWQLARDRQHAGSPQTQDGLRGEPSSWLPHSRLKPHMPVLCPACHLNLPAGRELPVRDCVTPQSPPLTLPSLDCCLTPRRASARSRDAPGPSDAPCGQAPPQGCGLW